MDSGIIDLLIGAGIVWGSQGIAALRTRQKARIKAGQPPRPVCGCEHAYAMHDLRTGECHAKVKRPDGWDGYGNAKHWVHDQCTCRHYTGPIPTELEFRPPPTMPRPD